MFSALVFAVALSAVLVQDPRSKPVAPVPDIAPKLAAWLQEPASADRDRIRSELVALGAPIVPALQEVVTRRDPAMGLALQVLCRVGEPARPALPQILAILGDRDFVEPPGQPAHRTVRGLLFESIREASWAADDVVPVLAKVAEDGKETDWFKTSAGFALGRMGRVALPVLSRWIGDQRGDARLRGVALTALGQTGIDAPEVVRPIAENPKDPLQESARWVLAGMEERAGRKSRDEYWADLVHEDPFGVNVRGWLMSAKQAFNSQRLHPLTQETKQLWRARLAEKPDAALAYQLAQLVQDQFSNSELGYGASRGYWAKEDPLENYATMAELLRVAQKQAERLTPLWARATRGLAKIALLRGDWDGMNAALAELGQPAVPSESRPWLTAPPKDWNALAETWQPCDPSMRSGDGGFEVHVEKGGRGLRGAHVLLRQKPPEVNFTSTGFDPRTLFDAPTSLSDDTVHRDSGFGYAADDREQTRYAVTDDAGVARFERLPPIEIVIEVMVPTADFIEPGSQWDLWTRESDGSLALDHYRWHEGFQLESGKTVQGPSLVVRPHFAMNGAEGQAITDRDFVLTWPALPESDATGAIHYEVELTLSFPAGKGLMMGPDTMARLATATVETKEHSWPLGADGIGNLKLVAGNVYLLQVTAKDAQGNVVARFGRTACYVPWSHRKSAAPLLGDLSNAHRIFEAMAPIDAKLWYLGQFRDGASGRVETLPERLDRYLREKPDAFEADYVRVARAWLRWHDAATQEAGAAEVAAARTALEELAKTLPAGNVAGDTAREVVRRIDAHVEPGKQLEYAIAAVR
jgi:hypothetical protein